MSDKDNAVYMTKMTREDLQEILTAAITASNRLNPLEEKQLKENMEKERRRAILSVELGYAEEESRWRKQHSCTHCVYPNGHRQAGSLAPRGVGEWCTGGQVHGNGTITLICNRCQTTWNWRASADEVQYALDAEHGLLGYEPPPIERCLNKDQFLTVRPTPPNRPNLAEMAR